jgi:hypothetical protein
MEITCDTFALQCEQMNRIIQQGRSAVSNMGCRFTSTDQHARFMFNGIEHTLEGFELTRRRWPVVTIRVCDKRRQYLAPRIVLRALGRRVVGKDGGKALFAQQVQRFLCKYPEWKEIVTEDHFLTTVKMSTGEDLLLGGFDTTNPTYPVCLWKELDGIEWHNRVTVDGLKNAWGLPDSVVPNLTKRVRRTSRKWNPR